LNRKLIIVFCFLCLTSALSAWGKKEASKEVSPVPVQEKAPVEIQLPERKTTEVLDEGSRVQVSGVVRLVGGGPIPELVITGQDREWHINKDEEYLLKDMQHQSVTVEGIETVTELKFANGSYAGEWRTLKEIKIIEIFEVEN